MPERKIKNLSMQSKFIEQSWKARKEILEENGFSEGKTGSPRQILKTAYSAGMIEEERKRRKKGKLEQICGFCVVDGVELCGYPLECMEISHL